jgi:hypothetical protein
MNDSRIALPATAQAGTAESMAVMGNMGAEFIIPAFMQWDP